MWFVIALLLAVAAAQYFWNLSTGLPLGGYDSIGHMQYIATILDECRLPHPLEGWSTFHPPLYYALASLVSWPSRPVWHPLAIEGISAIAMLIVGLVSFLTVLRLERSLPVAAVAAALALFVPCSQFAAIMVGNEALGAALAALAVPALLSLHADPGSLRMAARAGLLAGLALVTKYTGLFVATACIVPFCRRDLDRRGWRGLLVCAFLGAVVTGPIYLRNLHLTGSLTPLTRELEPMRSAEAHSILRERRLADYLWVDPAVFLRPSVPHLRGAEPGWENLNPAMTSVWGLTYASMWYDAHAHRIPMRRHRDGVYAGPVLLMLGILPTGVMLVGFSSALLEFLRRRGAGADAPLVVMGIVGLLTFIFITVRAPSTAAVKSSYLLPLVVPAAVFFGRGVRVIGSRGSRLTLAGSTLAALCAALVFTNGLLFPVQVLRFGAGRTSAQGSETPELFAVEQRLRDARMGRWRSVHPAMIQAGWTIDGWVMWQIKPHEFPAVNNAALATWCGYIGELMDRHLPEQPWLAVFKQPRGEPHSCDHTGRSRQLPQADSSIGIRRGRLP